MKRTTMEEQVKIKTQHANSENARKQPKQRETRLNGRVNKK